MSVITNNLLLGDEGYFLTKSLRFRSSASAYLNKTIGTGGANTKHATSFWMKRGNLTTAAYTSIYSAAIDANNYIYIYLTTGDRIGIYCQLSAATYVQLVSTLVLRDPSAWYHVFMAIDTTQATAANRFKLWLNGSEITSWFINTNNSTQNTGIPFGANCPHNIGRDNSTGSNYFDGYLAEFHDIWQPTTVPTVNDFGETSVTTGVWIPKKYTGTYGTNGFYLPFTDVATTSGSNAGLGKDFSGNSNYFNTNNISVTSGSTYDSMKDVPTLTDTDTANYATLNPLNLPKGGTLSNGNLLWTAPSAEGQAVGTMYVSSGKFYWEMVLNTAGAGCAFGIASITTDINNINLTAGSYVYYTNGNKYNGGSGSAYGATFTNGDIIGVALDLDAGTLVFYKNNTSQGTAFTGLSGTFTALIYDGTSASAPTYTANFGQRPFAYTPPTGFKALNTYNLPTPTIGATASSQANKYFDATLYTGTGANLSITNAGGFQPDFVWTKSRSAASTHLLFDSIRGVYNYLISATTDAEGSLNTTLTAFNSNGFSVGSNSTINNNGSTNVAWQWKANGSGSTNTAGSITSTVSANTTAGFSIVTYTGNGSNSTIGHGLGVAPSFIIAKARNSAQRWTVYTAALGNGYYGYLNETFAFDTANASLRWNTAPTSSVFGVGTSVDVNNNTTTYVAYCFAEVAGYSKFGSYTGNGSTDGTFVYTGFRPKFILIRRSDGIAGWKIYNTSGLNYNPINTSLEPHSSGAEATSTNFNMDLLSNGFKLKTTYADFNTNGGTYIYMAFAENPFKFSNAR